MVISFSFDGYDHIAVPVYVVAPDADGTPRFIAMNPPALLLLGLLQEDVIGRSARDLWPGAAGKTAYDHHLQSLHDGGSRSYTCIFGKNAALHRLRIDLLAVRDTAGTLSHTVGTITDLTAETDLRTSLDCATTQMEHFVALAAHDLRTPMRNVQILTDMLREGFEDHGDGKIDLIDLLEELAAASGGMITDVLAYSQSATATPETLTFALHPLCLAIGQVLDPHRRHRIRAPETTLSTDKLAVQIILRNLIDNAIKHSGNDRTCVDIAVTQSAPDRISFTVADDGAGFLNPGKVFLDTGTYRSECGYGLLGVQRLLIARGGDISVVPQAGRPGGAVIFSMPGTVL